MMKKMQIMSMVIAWLLVAVGATVPQVGCAPSNSGPDGPDEDLQAASPEYREDPAPPDLPGITTMTTGPAALWAFPIQNKHNTGWDVNWSFFSLYPHPTTTKENSDYSANHLGIDIFAPRWSTVISAMNGTVTRIDTASSNPLGGISVYVTDSYGWTSYYCHLQMVDPLVKVKMKVYAGQTRLGWVGNTGSGAQYTAPHLHFSVYPDGVYAKGINPFNLLMAVDPTSAYARVMALPNPITPGQTLTEDGWNFSPLTDITLVFKYPGGFQTSLSKKTDALGNFTHQYTPSSTSARGQYCYSAVDANNKKSNSVCFSIQ